jgi:hypothetical protein
MILLAFEWTYDPYLDEVLSYRRKFLNELDNMEEKIKHFKQTIESCLERLNSLELNILKRLEWSSGTIPSLSDNIKEFEIKRKTRNEYFIVSVSKNQTLSVKICSYWAFTLRIM